MPAAIKVAGDLTNRLVQLAVELASHTGTCRRALARHAARAVSVFHYEAVNARQEAAHALDAGFLPVEISVRRSGEERVHARAVRAVTANHVVRRNDIAFAF